MSACAAVLLRQQRIIIGKPLIDPADQVAGAQNHMLEALLHVRLGGHRPDPALPVTQLPSADELGELLPAHGPPVLRRATVVKVMRQRGERSWPSLAPFRKIPGAVLG